jgi:hypothetical protein
MVDNSRRNSRSRALQDHLRQDYLTVPKRDAPDDRPPCCWQGRPFDPPLKIRMATRLVTEFAGVANALTRNNFADHRHSVPCSLKRANRLRPSRLQTAACPYRRS